MTSSARHSGANLPGSADRGREITVGSATGVDGSALSSTTFLPPAVMESLGVLGPGGSMNKFARSHQQPSSSLSPVAFRAGSAAPRSFLTTTPPTALTGSGEVGTSTTTGPPPGTGAGATSASLLSQTFAPGSRTSTSLTPSASNVGKIMSVSSTSNTQNSVNEAVMKGMRLGLGGAGGMGAAGVGVGAGAGGARAGGGLDETLNMNFANSLSSSNGGGARSSGSPEAGGTGESTSASKRRINAAR